MNHNDTNNTCRVNVYDDDDDDDDKLGLKLGKAT
jgi:hypothetical protein